jgi:predicted TIM-barrel fold metal-dependent hydrolase
MKLLLLSCVCLFPLAQLPGRLRAHERPPIIDMHLHADLPPYEIPAGAPALCRPEPCRGQGHATASSDATLEQTLRSMERHSIVKGVVSGLALDIVAKWVRAKPDLFIGSPFLLKPDQHDLKRLRQEYAAGRLGAMGEIGTQLSGIPPNDPALEPYLALAKEFDVPVLSTHPHTAALAATSRTRSEFRPRGGMKSITTSAPAAVTMRVSGMRVLSR